MVTWSTLMMYKAQACLYPLRGDYIVYIYVVVALSKYSGILMNMVYCEWCDGDDEASQTGR
jgi:hypothetical protein